MKKTTFGKITQDQYKIVEEIKEKVEHEFNVIIKERRITDNDFLRGKTYALRKVTNMLDMLYPIERVEKEVRE